MKRAVVGLVAALSLASALPVLAVEGTQSATGTAPNFEQMKADHLKRIDDRINSLQEEKVCVQAAKSREDLRACRSKHKAEMKDYRGKKRKGRGPGGPGSQVPPQ